MDTLKHEIAHSLFYTSEEYRSAALRILTKLDLPENFAELQYDGYSSSVWLDECQAYRVGGYWECPAELNEFFDKHAP